MKHIQTNGVTAFGVLRARVQNAAASWVAYLFGYSAMTFLSSFLLCTNVKFMLSVQVFYWIISMYYQVFSELILDIRRMMVAMAHNRI